MRFEELIDTDPEAKIIELLEAAHDRLWMGSRLHPDFYNREKVKQAMITTANKVNEFHLLFDTQANWQERKSQLPWIVDLVKNGRITIRKSEYPIPHWMVVDGKHFRLEKEHPQNVTKTSNLIIWDSFKPIADMLQDTFNSWWIQAGSIE